jgi:hypothetical protein
MLALFFEEQFHGRRSSKTQKTGIGYGEGSQEYRQKTDGAKN